MKTLLIILAIIVGTVIFCVLFVAIMIWLLYDPNYISRYDEFNIREPSNSLTYDKIYRIDCRTKKA